MTLTPPTHAQMLSVVDQRVPSWPLHKKSKIAWMALGVLKEPKHAGKPWMHAVKMAVARSYKSPHHRARLHIHGSSTVTATAT